MKKFFLRFVVFNLLLFSVTSVLFAQSMYVTFNQNDLSQKKVNAGRKDYKVKYFGFVNTLNDTVKGIHIRFNKYTTIALREFGIYTIYPDGSMEAYNGYISPGDTAHLYNFTKGLQVIEWWWMDEGRNKLGPTNTLIVSGTETWHYDVQPNGGNVRDYLYKKIIKRSGGLVIGIPQLNRDSAKVYGWIRYLTSDRQYFPHVWPYYMYNKPFSAPGAPSCFDNLLDRTGLSLSFHKELKNPKVTKHRNHLLGELHALKLAVIANDNGVTEPIGTGFTLFGDLLYHDTVTCELDTIKYTYKNSNSGDSLNWFPQPTNCWGYRYCNGMTIRQIAHIADSMLTYCGRFELDDYIRIDKCITRINSAFDCNGFTALSFDPLLLQGCHMLPNYLSAATLSKTLAIGDVDLTVPDEFALRQNYPNPFNPTTTIEFNLIEPSVVTLKVYNLLGEEVATLLDNEMMENGSQAIELDANGMASGVYFYKIIAQGEHQHQYRATKRMVLIK